MEWELEVDVTGESFNKGDIDTLTTVLQTIATNPAVLNDPNAKLIFNKILTLTGAVSPVEIMQVQPVQKEAPANKVSESISFKDLPPDGQVQMAKQAGINLQPSVAPPGGGVAALGGLSAINQ